ncbi:SRPBCC domain-containing protein [Sphingomonas sp. H160509]|uniref:SRPBCC domain-containing protein n=1 Tax=Sphingomonas sp. H160509 TaxID=2955313 RepID=UPI002097CDEA|nr:SRPBCC domain-containing protein [Sphingomonas sp. H160509]MDD1452040.1 SRPBCC domain-containing protein [Sphingomonas sp. H160509]
MNNSRELSVERRIAAPVEAVWRTMTNRFEEWFCPRPWRAEARDIEWRPGGRSLVVMHGPNGEEMPNEGVVLEYETNRRFVFTDAFTAGWKPSGPFMVGLFEIAPDGDGTLFTATARHWTDEALEQHRSMGFEGGWGAMADQLKTLAEGGTL